MKDIKSFNGERLKAARTYNGLTVAQLAEKLELQRQTVSMYENNKITNPDFQNIKKMSETLNFPIDFFLESECEALNIEIAESTYFRALLTTSKKYRNQQIQKMNFIAIIFAFISEYIRFKPLNLPCTNEYFTANEAAKVLRELWGLSDKPIENLVYTAEQNGLLLTSYQIDTSDIDAFSQCIDIDGETRYLIALSKNKNTAARLHFDVAHELGHILLHEWSEDIESLSNTEFKEREQQAHDFASAFLLPAEPFIRDVGIYADKLSYYIELKKKWRVSIAAMIRRSLNLGLIKYDSYQSLMRQMQKRGIRREEPLDDVLITAQPTLLKTAVDMLINDKVLTPREFINELSQEYNLTLGSDVIESLLGLDKDTLKISNVIPLHSLELK